MPVITIYLNQQLWEFVKNDKSRIIQQAIKELMNKSIPSIQDSSKLFSKEDLQLNKKK
jgi:hypothetical protein